VGTHAQTHYGAQFEWLSGFALPVADDLGITSYPLPGGRISPAVAQDESGNLWLYGGFTQFDLRIFYERKGKRSEKELRIFSA
jgi:hypothetical protein